MQLINLNYSISKLTKGQITETLKTQHHSLIKSGVLTADQFDFYSHQINNRCETGPPVSVVPGCEICPKKI